MTTMGDTDAAPAPGNSPAPPSGTKSRAGRNLPAAIGVGAVLAAMIIFSLLYQKEIWVGIISVFLGIAMWEVTKRLRQADISVPFIPLFVGGQAMIWLTWPWGTAGALGAFGATVVVCMIWRLVGHGLNQQPVNYLRDVAITVFVAAWIPLFASFGALLVYPENGAEQVFCLMLGVTFSDIGGYAAGVLFGKHPMAPAISPKKSWEGLAGSLLVGTTASTLAVTFLLGHHWVVGIALGIMLVITGTLGDLVESQVKRDLGIKDMGTLLPGHGGIMDRLDSLLPSAVATWIVLTLFI